jgi:hypothetical protein
MLPRPSENPWMRRTKWLTQALIISGTLNIGLIATFAYFVLKEKHETFALELKPSSKDPKEVLMTNVQLLRSYSVLPYPELLLRLENRELIEEGLTKRDLSLGCLVAFHHFDLDKALSGASLQKRMIPYTNHEGQESIEIPVFPGLSDEQFQAILHYAKTEKWPLTSQGLFYELKRSLSPRDPSLLEAFYLSSEYYAVYHLLTKSGLMITPEQTVDLICEGEWKTLADLTAQQRMAMELTPDRRRIFLLEYLNNNSKCAAKFLLDSDLDFVLKRLDDGQILKILDLYTDKSPTLENFAKELLASPRTDSVWKRAASLLYSFANESVPDPYNHQVVLQRFLPQLIPAQQPVSSLPKLVPKHHKKKMHVVEPGDNLWKIARKYQVSVEDIKRINHLDTEKLRPGRQIEIPEKK